MQVRQVRHVRVLQSRSRLVIKLRCVRAQYEQGDRELVEFHGRIVLRGPTVTYPTSNPSASQSAT